jgi:hypothetical protein
MKEQFKITKRKTNTSHVMEFGDKVGKAYTVKTVLCDLPREDRRLLNIGIMNMKSTLKGNKD